MSQKEDTVLFLLSGGASALFEKPLIPEEELTDITKQLMACGADITEINTIRKRLSAVNEIAGLKGTALFSVGSDGTDGPTDAAGGYCDGRTKELLEKEGVHIFDVLRQNDAYHALEKVNGLIFTGATGTNVNDVAVLLIRK